MPFLKVEMFGTHKGAMSLSLATLILIYKTDSAGSQTYPFPIQNLDYTI